MITIQRRLTIEYDGVNDVAYMYFVPKEDAPETARNTKRIDLDEGEGILGALLLDRDDLNRIMGIEFLGALGLLRPEFLLEGDDPIVDWTQPPQSIMKRVRSLTEKAAIKTFIERVKTVASETRRDVATVLDEESRLL